MITKEMTMSEFIAEKSMSIKDKRAHELRKIGEYLIKHAEEIADNGGFDKPEDVEISITFNKNYDAKLGIFRNISLK